MEWFLILPMLDSKSVGFLGWNKIIERFLSTRCICKLFLWSHSEIRLGPGQLLLHKFAISCIGSKFITCRQWSFNNSFLIIMYVWSCFRWAQLMQLLIEGYQKAGLLVEWHFSLTLEGFAEMLGVCRDAHSSAGTLQ